MKIRSVPEKSASNSAVKLCGFICLHQTLRFHSFAFSKIAVSMKKSILKSWQKSRNCKTISLLNQGFARLKRLRKVSFETISLIWDVGSLKWFSDALHQWCSLSRLRGHWMSLSQKWMGWEGEREITTWEIIEPEEAREMKCQWCAASTYSGSWRIDGSNWQRAMAGMVTKFIVNTPTIRLRK